MKKMKSIISVLIVCSLLSACAATGKEMVKEAPLIPVETTKVTKQGIRSEMIYAGQINPIASVQVTGKMSGKVEKTYFEVGDVVKAGDVLFSLDKKDIQNQISQLQSQLNIADTSIESAENGLKTVTGGQYESQIMQMQTAVENGKKQLENAEIALSNAKLALDNAESTYEKIKILYDAGTVSQTEFDNTELAYEQRLAAVEQAEVGLSTATLALSQAESSLALSSGKITDENVQKAQLGVNQASASKESIQVQLNIAQSTLEDATVTSPISGVVSSKLVKESEMTSVQVAGYTIVDIDVVLVKVKVSELIINAIYPSQEVDVVIGAIGETKLKGVINSISPAADQTSTFPVEIKIANPDGNIKPGMFAEVRFLRESSENTIVLPRNTILENDMEKFVFINDNGTAKKVIVTTGIDNGENIEILKGLQENDEVITKGQTFVSTGDKINVVTSQSKGA